MRRAFEVSDEVSIYFKLSLKYDFRDLESVQTHLSKSCLSIYSMESMIYLTAGILDEFNGPDVSLESAITKVCFKYLFRG